MEETIKVSGLSRSYAGNQIIKNLTFAVKAGEVYGLLGANGAGKTTTIECMLGTRKADAGSVSILGLDPWRNRKQIFEQVGVQFQEAGYSDKIKVKELCEETACLYCSTANYEELLRRFDLWEKKDSFVNELSGGQKQRLFIVLALLPDPKVVFLDELTTGFDTKARRSVWKSLITLKEKGLTIFLSSHFMDEVETLCDTIAILKEGNFIFTGTVQEAIDRSPYDSLEEAYLWFTGEEEMDNE